MDAFRRGWTVAIVLAVITIVEYFFAIEVSNNAVRFIGLAVLALVKVGLIGAYFMHFMRLFHTEEVHA